ncbi:MAG: cellulase family glycosylhydrolase [Pirellulales bacterium]
MFAVRVQFAVLIALVVTAGSTVSAQEKHQPLALHPDNGHYFLFRGKPTVIVTSAEHYGAVLNLDFDYVKYLDELAAHGLNNTRTFSGAYVEDSKAFNIARNTLAPAKGRFICPWARSDEPGYAHGGNKFALMKWDDAYFKRLKDFVAAAARRGVIVEMNLFCPFYQDSMWNISPQNAANNINNVGRCKREEAYTLDKNDGLLAIQEEMTRKIVRELNGFDNLYYEICNEPYFGGVTMDWQHRIVDTIVATEKELPNKHLISLNIANGSKKIEKPHPAVSVFNFHYASPPTAVAENYHLNKVIGDNETGFKGTKDDHYRMEAWEFILAGGGLYNNLDYSFTVGHEDGTFQYPAKQPGGGNRGFRRQMKVLKDFIDGFDFVRMKPAKGVIGGLDKDERATVLAEEGKQYAAYLRVKRPKQVTIELPAGTYEAAWINVLTGKTIGKQRFTHESGDAKLQTAGQTPEVALRIMRVE